MTHNKNKSLGIDVSKACLDVYCEINNTHKSFQNNASGIQELIQWLQESQFDLHRVILEPSGGYEREAFYCLVSAGFPVSLVHAKRPRDYAHSRGHLAKTDRLDSQLLASYGSAISPPLTLLSTEGEHKMASLVLRRLQLVDLRKKEKNRLEKPTNSFIADDIRETIQYLNQKIKSIETQITKLLASNEFAERHDILTDVNGVAQVTSSTLLGLLPEIGRLSNGEIGMLVGLAPVTQESGKWKGRSCIKGGRGNVRKTLYSAAKTALIYNARLKAYFDHLMQQGKPYKVCMVAVMRKLLIILNGRMKNYYSGREVY